MTKVSIILVGDNDPSHFELIKKNLSRAGVSNEILHFTDVQKILDFLFKASEEPEQGPASQKYLLLLDICLGKVDGVEVLTRIKQDEKLKKVPVIILAGSDEPDIIEKCHNLGCSTYIVKPPEDRDFEKTVQKIGRFLSVVEITSIE